MLLTPVERSHRPQRASIRRGEFRSYTFRLGAQAPLAEITLGLDSDDGCLVLYASNCSERPLARSCQWTLVVDAQRQRRGRLAVKTHELHYTAGMVHVGIYCVRDAVFEVAATVPGAAPAGVGAGRGRAPTKWARPREAWRPVGAGAARGGARATRARRVRYRYSSFLLHGTKSAAAAAAATAARNGGRRRGYHARIGGDWYAGLRHVLEVGEATPRRKPPGYVSFPVAVASPRARRRRRRRRAAAPASASASPPASPRAEYERPWSRGRRRGARRRRARRAESPRAAIASRPSGARVRVAQDE